MILVVCLVLTMIPFGGLTGVAATDVHVKFDSMDQWNGSYMKTYYKDNSGFTETENYLEGSGSVGCEVKDTNNHLTFFFSSHGQSFDITGAEYLTFDLWVPRADYFKGSSSYWTDLRGDDAAHANLYGEGYDAPCHASAAKGKMRDAFAGLQAGWNHIAIPLDQAATTTDLVSLRMRVQANGRDQFVNMQVGDKVYFDDFRFVSSSVLTNEIAKINAAKDVTVAIRALPAVSALTRDHQSAVESAVAAYNGLEASYRSYVLGYGTLQAAASRMEQIVGNDVDVSFMTMDTDQVTTYFENDNGTVTTETFTQGAGAFACVTKEAQGKNLFYMFADIGSGVDITGATHLMFDLWCEREGMFDQSSGWSDLYVWTHEGKGDLGWSQAQPYAIATAAGNQSSDNTEAQKAFRNLFGGLKAGWNTIAIPLDATVTNGANAQIFRLRVSSVESLKKGETVIFDDFRFVNQVVLDEVVPVRNRAKQVIAALAEGITKGNAQQAVAMYNSLDALAKTYVPVELVEKARPIKSGVDVTILSMDRVECTTYFENNGGTITQTNFTQGVGGYECVAKEPVGNNLFCMFADTIQNPVDITGATHLVFDLWVPRDNAFDNGRGWSDLYVWSLEGKGNMSWDSAQPYAIASAAGFQDSPDTEAQKAFRRCFEGLKTGWNTVVIPLDARVANGAGAQAFRLRVYHAPNLEQGDKVIFDNFRFVSPDVLAKDDTARQNAFPVIDLIAKAVESGNAADVSAARTAYDRLSEISRSFVANAGALELVEEQQGDVGGFASAASHTYRVKHEFARTVKTLEATVYMPQRAVGQSGSILGTVGSNNPAMNFEVNGQLSPQITVVNGLAQSTVYTFHQVQLPTKQWVHLAYVWDATAHQIHCYVDGELKQSLNCLDHKAWKATTAYYLAGDYTQGNANCFKGRLKNLAVYGDARTADEIRSDKITPGQEDLLAAYTFEGLTEGFTAVEDQSGNQNPIVQRVRWMNEGPQIRDYAYSFAFVGDTQGMMVNAPDRFHELYDWLVGQAKQRKMKFVFGLGDITQHNTTEQWEIGMDAITRLDGVVDYSIIRGNHDGSENYNNYVTVNDFSDMADGMYQGNLLNYYRTFKVGEIDYLLLVLDYDPSDDALAWANDVVAGYPNHQVIVTTHSYMYADGVYTNDGGVDVWNKLVRKHENIVMVVCGHIHCDQVIKTEAVGDKGNRIVQVLTNHQDVEGAEKPTGMVTMMYFSQDGRNVQVETYATLQNQWLLDVSQFSFTLGSDEEQEPDPGPGPTDQEIADEVIAKIDALNVQSLDDASAVSAARRAYDELTDAQKDLVTNLAKLVDAEAKIAQLEKPIDPPVTVTYGDVDGNGKVEATDALEVLKSVVGKVTLTDEQLVKADTDGNGKADATDALNILKKVVGKIDKFPVEQ